MQRDRLRALRASCKPASTRSSSSGQLSRIRKRVPSATDASKLAPMVRFQLTKPERSWLTSSAARVAARATMSVVRKRSSFDITGIQDTRHRLTRYSRRVHLKKSQTRVKQDDSHAKSSRVRGQGLQALSRANFIQSRK